MLRVLSGLERRSDEDWGHASLRAGIGELVGGDTSLYRDVAWLICRPGSAENLVEAGSVAETLVGGQAWLGGQVGPTT
ncbi:hypothetical protein ACH40E_32760 [Streptomyces acidicola]|uniref:hypothetical protein n=1 Tax=Streptomyces acidicola TaxID=2596892 RepID=UPI00378D0838